MYEDMYKNYSDEEFDYSYPYSFRLENKKYLESYYQIDEWWYYGDTKTIQFVISDNIEDSYDGKIIKLSFYNFRKEEIVSKEYTQEDIEISDAKLIIEYDLDYETSNNIFTEGIYYCGIDVISKDEEDEITSCETILDRDSYLIRVI